MQLEFDAQMVKMIEILLDLNMFTWGTKMSSNSNSIYYPCKNKVEDEAKGRCLPYQDKESAYCRR